MNIDDDYTWASYLSGVLQGLSNTVHDSLDDLPFELKSRTQQAEEAIAAFDDYRQRRRSVIENG